MDIVEKISLLDKCMLTHGSAGNKSMHRVCSISTQLLPTLLL